MMSVVRILCLSAMVAIAGLMTAGSGAASATTLCEVNVAPCPAGNSYPAAEVLEFGLKAGGVAVFKGESVTAQCTGSGGEEEGVLAGTPLRGEVNSLTFTSCSFCKKVSVLNLPWGAGILATGGGNGTIEFVKRFIGDPTFELTECAENNTCVFEETTLTLTIKGGNPATMTATAVPLDIGFGSGPLCGAAPFTATWSATYVISSPAPLFVI